MKQKIAFFFDFVTDEIICIGWPEKPLEYLEGLKDLYFQIQLNSSKFKEDTISLRSGLLTEINYCRKRIGDEIFLKKIIDFLILLEDNHLNIFVFFEILSEIFDFGANKVLIQNIIKNYSEQGKLCIKQIILNELTDESIIFYENFGMQEYLERLRKYKSIYVDFEPIDS